MSELSKLLPIAVGIAPFCAKRRTPLDGQPFAGIDVVQERLARLRSGLKGRADVRATSAKCAWVEYVLAQWLTSCRQLQRTVERHPSAGIVSP